MKKYIPLFLSVVLAFSFVSCSQGADSKEVRAVCNNAQQSLVEFNTDEIEKYVNSETLTEIKDLVNEKEDYKSLAKAIFANLEIKVRKVSVDETTGKGTVTLKIKNKDLKTVTTEYISSMTAEYLKGNVDLKDEEFVKAQLKDIEKRIEGAKDGKFEKITVKVQKNDNGQWILFFDSSAENAVMGGSANTLKSLAKMG